MEYIQIFNSNPNSKLENKKINAKELKEYFYKKKKCNNCNDKHFEY